jgi:hypothetical protein
MAFFSRLKKAKKAADQHKKATEQAAVAEETKPMPAPYKHVPVHAAQDALSATPTRWSPQETRARIAEARKTMSQMPISAPVTANHSRANSEISFPIASVSRSRSDLSIATIMTQPQSSRFSTPINYYRSPVPPMPTIPSQHKPKPSEEQHAFVAPRDAPQPQPRTQRSRYSHRPSHSVSSNTRARSPLSNVSVEEGMSREAIYPIEGG